jgi:two-component system OmpR family response regulator/two-component system response regulator QseB
LAILIVEDESAVANVISRYLERRGNRVECVESAEAARKALAGRKFDCVLLDNGLPGAMGITALPELAALTTAPIIMITGYPNEDVVKDALLLGAKAFMPKPLDLAELERRILELAP